MAKSLRRGVYSSERLQLIKQAIEQYDPKPFSGLTAMSDFAANRKYAPKPPKQLTSEQQAAMNKMKANLPPANQRTVSKVEAARKNPVD